MAIVGMLGASRYPNSSLAPARDNAGALQLRLAGNLPLIMMAGVPSWVGQFITILKSQSVFVYQCATAGATNASYLGYMYIAPSAYPVPKTGKWYIGARLITAGVLSLPMVHVNVDGTVVALGPNAASSQEYYIEVIIDWVALSITVYVNGTAYTKAFTSTVGFVAIGSYSDTNNPHSLIPNLNYSFGLTDMYLVHDAPDDVAPTGRLGAVNVKPLSMAGVQGADGWGTSDAGGVILTNINTAVTYNPNVSGGDTRVTPFAITSASESAATFIPNAPAAGNIKGVQLDVLANRAAAANSVLATTAGTDGNMSAEKITAVVDNVSSPSQNTTVSYVFDQSPDGNPWSPTSVASLRISARSRRNVQ